MNDVHGHVDTVYVQNIEHGSGSNYEDREYESSAATKPIKSLDNLASDDNDQCDRNW